MGNIDIIEKYFDNLTDVQKHQFRQLQDLYAEWNEKVNVISRKDIENLYERHILHSLSIAKIIEFKPGSEILDVGTGGGFPGIPLAILFPKVKFHLVDSIGKKINVVNEIAKTIGLTNVIAEQIRAEKVDGEYDFVVSRAVTRIDVLYKWVRTKVSHQQGHELNNGIICLKGGDLKEEFSKLNKKKFTLTPMTDIFEEDFFETKKVAYVPIAR
ncbi:16S rRNA (guanine(527)-N(7))-methyltransferase RsmG [Flammeovirga yaeyamensis]|uniref:Ribosomal RNA small subunit methyltransferase G n=1 Tax=Flammeovirga yaeyamensis TaxID=367791 RepID=A0AAX1MZD9_9BACT|nr:16S rRNA (guanine(527)-N(7))-methyltransferase RsmG [Flammeovirga yaeyamensis]MBB3700866.1 16S rRNA (guanine527-N7)-methyltransferase [Flammeovirga yaeyamensis]NMF37974.1 16S rRNA (guanine(527)-N(7))-methyltransferase RsmG [Flammeovirga yaeyamensis]QWG00625.1 16S rRNA (guanine(527)-N(7))-methyltransferase RsmG [Flammeovirga yaeyamensis]